MAKEKAEAEKPKEKKVEKKGKKIRKGRKHESCKIYSFYSIKDGKILRTKKACPRCGSGTWMANHKNRIYCGHCGYTEFEKVRD
jgi:small subunit ribosomal protein S27Ae